jgi:pyridine nucleotide-disulfide oxidoreductase family protein
VSEGTKSIVLLGVGHTNAHVVKEWAKHPIPGCTLTCISKFPTATYSGMLPGTLGRQFNDNEMRIDLQRLVDRAGARLVLADTCGLDLDAGTILFSDHERIPFDALSIGVGSMPAGWDQHAKSPLLVPIKPMQTFLERLANRLQSASAKDASALRIAIVGGGVASVEIALCLRELLLKDQVYRNAKIAIFTSSDRVADGMRDRSVNRIEKLLQTRNVPVHTGQRVAEVGDTEIVLDDDSRHPVDCVIWSTGAAAPPVLATLGLQTDERGFIATSPTLQSLTDPRIFAVGDSGTVIQSPSPKAGVYAVRQCPILWHNLRALLHGGPMQPFKPQNDFLKLLNTGDGKALLEYYFFTAHARWCWKLKTWIDRRFVSEFHS